MIAPQLQMSSGRVVPIVSFSCVSLTVKLMSLKMLWMSLYSISESAMVVLSSGSQLLMRSSS